MNEVSRNAAMEIARRTEKNLGFIKAEFDRMGETPRFIWYSAGEFPSRDGYIAPRAIS